MSSTIIGLVMSQFGKNYNSISFVVWRGNSSDGSCFMISPFCFSPIAKVCTKQQPSLCLLSVIIYDVLKSNGKAIYFNCFRLTPTTTGFVCWGVLLPQIIPTHITGSVISSRSIFGWERSWSLTRVFYGERGNIPIRWTLETSNWK